MVLEPSLIKRTSSPLLPMVPLTMVVKAGPGTPEVAAYPATQKDCIAPKNATGTEPTAITVVAKLVTDANGAPV